MTEQSSEKLYCVNHPQRETLLRCNRCNNPICTECAVLTPTGYRCKNCVRGQQKHFDTAKIWDFPLAVIVGGVLAFVGSFSADILSFFTFFIAPIIGVGIAYAIQWTTRRRRSKALFTAATIAVVIGTLPLLIISIINALYSLKFGSAMSVDWWSLAAHGIYTVLVSSTVYYRVSGIQL
jgi:hypothetical protein